MNSLSEIFDLIIIGAGPAGLTAAIFARNKNLNTLMFEGLKPGGQLANLYPNKPVFNYPGYAQIEAGKLAETMLQQSRDQEADRILNQTVTHLKTGPDNILHIFTGAQVYKSKSMILAAGLGLLQPRKLGIPGEADGEGQSVYYHINDIADWQNLNVAVIGGGNSAADNALLLHQQGCSVTLIHQLRNFQADAESMDRIARSSITVLTETKMLSVNSENHAVTELALQRKSDSSPELLHVDRVLINIGLKPNLGFLNDSPVKVVRRKVPVTSEMHTSCPGVFACGDLVDYPGKIRLIVTAIGEAATAVNSAGEHIKLLEKGSLK